MRGYAALTAMEQQLDGLDYFVGDQYSIADIALYAYTHVAHEGGFDLDRVPGDQRLARPRRRTSQATSRSTTRADA